MWNLEFNYYIIIFFFIVSDISDVKVIMSSTVAVIFAVN